MEHRSELLRLLSSLCDDQLSDADQSRLEELLADEDARRVYLQYLDMHARLLTHQGLSDQHNLSAVDAVAGMLGGVAGRASAIGSSPDRRAIERPSQRLFQALSYAAVAAATLAATVLVQIALHQPQQPTT